MCGKFLAALLLVVAPSLSAQSSILSAARLDFDGIGPIRIGMTIPQAIAAAKLKIKTEESGPDSECESAASVAGPAGLGFTLVNKRIATISIVESGIPTFNGIRVGDTERKVLEAFKGMATFSPRSKEDMSRRASRNVQGPVWRGSRNVRCRVGR